MLERREFYEERQTWGAGYHKQIPCFQRDEVFQFRDKILNSNNFGKEKTLLFSKLIVIISIIDLI